MAVEPSLKPDPLKLSISQGLAEPGTSMTPDPLMIEQEDGGMIIDFTPPEEMTPAMLVAHDDNLAEVMDERDLVELGSDLVEKYESDLQSRADWEKTYIEGLDLLGLKMDDRSEPWDGACGVYHPMLTEAVIRFQSQTIQEVFPASGPAKARIEGKQDTEVVRQSHRVVNFLNYNATKVMKEYRPETEKLLFSLPIAGSAFRKVYFDPSLGRSASMFVPAEDFVVNYGTSDLSTCERATHVMKKGQNAIRKLQRAGYYRDVELGNPKTEVSEVRRKYDEAAGVEPSYENDDRHTLLEMLVEIDLPGFEDEDEEGQTGIGLPYVVTIDKSSKEVLSIYRNWDENDQFKTPLQHFVHYQYMPGVGFYGFGLVHTIGGLAKTSTSLLRQLVDAGTLANLPGGLKTRGLRVKGDSTPIRPGEWRDVDTPGTAIRDNILPLPYKEPSTVLYQLLGDVVQEGRRFASAADVKVSDMNTEAPVGTTLAILEREMKILSAVQARVHHAMGEELQILSRLIGKHGPESYPYETEGDYLPREDFSSKVDIQPVSDPNAGTMAQRIMLNQAAMMLAQQDPSGFNMNKLKRRMLESLGMQEIDEILPDKTDIPPMDPVAENMAILQGEPVKAHYYQDHEAHIQAHMSMSENPEIAGMLEKNPMAQAIMAAGAAHITEHIAMAYRRAIEEELGTRLPPPGDPLPEDIEYRISQLVAPAAAQLTGKAQQKAQAEENARRQEDPIIQLQQREMGLKEREQDRKEMQSRAELELKFKQHLDKMGLEHTRLEDQNDTVVFNAIADFVEAQLSRSDSQTARAEAREDKAFQMAYQSYVDLMRSLREDNNGNGTG